MHVARFYGGAAVFHDVGLSAHDEPENGRHFRPAAPPAAAAGRAARGLDGRGRAVADVSGAHAHARRHLGAARHGAARSGHGALLVSVYAHCTLCALADPLRRDPGARQVRAGVSVRAGGGRVGAYDPDDGAAGWCGAVCRSGHFRQAQDLRWAHGHVRARLPARQLRKRDPKLAACARRGRAARGDLGRYVGAHGAHGGVQPELPEPERRVRDRAGIVYFPAVQADVQSPAARMGQGRPPARSSRCRWRSTSCTTSS